MLRSQPDRSHPGFEGMVRPQTPPRSEAHRKKPPLNPADAAGVFTPADPGLTNETEAIDVFGRIASSAERAKGAKKDGTGRVQIFK